MTARERFRTILARKIPDRIGYYDSFWGETITRWRKEGMPEDISPDDYFNTELRSMGADQSLQFPEVIIEETEEYKIYTDANGVKRKDLKENSGWTPQWLDFTIKTKEDWLKHRHRMEVNEKRLPENMMESYNKVMAEDKFVTFGGSEPYECSWPKLGQVGIFTMMMDDPDCVADIFQVHAEQLIGNHKLMASKGLKFDGAFLFGDMGYRSGPLFSPKIYRELLFPRHKMICAYFHSQDMPIILHSCGKIEPLLPMLIEAGFDAIQPLEAKVGQDVRKLKKEFGNAIVFFGNIDVRILSTTKEAIEEEMGSKITIAKQGGGYIYHCDHSIPPTVSFDNYKFVVECVQKYGKY